MCFNPRIIIIFFFVLSVYFGCLICLCISVNGITLTLTKGTGVLHTFYTRLCSFIVLLFATYLLCQFTF